MKENPKTTESSTYNPLDRGITLDKAACALAQDARRFVVGRHPVDCHCKGTGWIAVHDPVLGDLIDIRCPATNLL